MRCRRAAVCRAGPGMTARARLRPAVSAGRPGPLVPKRLDSGADVCRGGALQESTHVRQGHPAQWGLELRQVHAGAGGCNEPVPKPFKGRKEKEWAFSPPCRLERIGCTDLKPDFPNPRMEITQ